MPDPLRLAESGQEQAVAAWINHLNQLRLDSLLSAFRRQDLNLRDALASVDEALRRIDLDVVARNRGGLKGMHGFIAEVAEVGVGNARSRIVGDDAVYGWVNDNGPVDLLRGGVEIQQKFVAAGGRFGLGAVAEHLRKYQLPSDHVDVIRTLHDLPREDAVRLLTRSGDGPSLRDWERVRAFFEEGAVGIEALEPSTFEYREVQLGAYESTLQGEKESLRSTDRSVRDDAYRSSRPKLAEGAKATAVAAAVEGGTAFVMAVVRKRR